MSSSSSTTTTTLNNNNKHVGILAMEVYTPRTFVSQARLETYMGVEAGKYTIGLGQEGLALTGDAEDINSIALTVVHALLEKYQIDPRQIGRLEVGTETLVDKSKSTKTVLMSLFPDEHTDLEGATMVNACYGGTAALLNAFLWCESDGWDGRYAVVVAADIATYAAGPARPTCGVGAVAVLVGRDAPLAFDPRLRATHASHVWDFFKPNHAVEYPTVDGALSQVCYYRALEDCYQRFVTKMEESSTTTGRPWDATTPDYFVFHAPYNKLVQKSYARLFFMDAQRQRDVLPADHPLSPWLHVPSKDTYGDKQLEGVLKQMSAPHWTTKMTDANRASQKVGNTYTASVFLGLASLVDGAGRRGDLTPGRSLVLFSYGSGALATMYHLQVRTPTDASSPFTVENMASLMRLTERIEEREEVDPRELDLALDTRARMHQAGAPYKPVYPTVGRLFPGTYYLVEMDDQWRRTYARVPLDAEMVPPGTPLAPPAVLELAAPNRE